MDFDLKNKCRVCLGDDKELHFLFEEFDQGITLQYILTNTTGYQIEENDGFSPYICQNCTTIVVEFYNLKTIYEENENQVKSLLANSEASLHEKEDEEEAMINQENQSDDECDYITIKVESYSSDNESSVDYHAKEEHVSGSGGATENTGNNENGANYEYREINTFTCPECGDCFLYKNDIHAHMVSKHDVAEVDYDEVSESSLLKVEKHDQIVNKCKVCSQTFPSKEEYKDHLETHKKNVCDICGVGFIKKSYLKDHQEIHCTEKRHVCNFCNKAFKRRTVLVKHRRIHTHPRQCICEVCGKAFNDKGTLKTHIMLVHVRERNYMCLICGIKFPLKGTLEKHVRRHQNKEREFFCSQCPLAYRDKSSLDRHVHVKHSGKNVKETCGDCGKRYTTIGNLFKHQRNCHNSVLTNDV